MILSTRMDVKTAPLCKKVAENEFALFQGTLPRGSPLLPTQRLSSEAELRGLAAMPGNGLERFFPLDSCVFKDFRFYHLGNND